MIELAVPVSIQEEIALEIADNHQLYQEDFPLLNLRNNQWNSVDHCVLNCGHTNGRSSVHTSTGAFSTKCCHKKGNNYLDFLLEKYMLSKQEAIKKVSEKMSISVLEMPRIIRGTLPLIFSQTLSTNDGEVVQMLGHYEYGPTLVFNTDVEVFEEELVVNRVRYATTEVISGDEYYSYYGDEFFLPELIENASANGLIKSGAVININGALFIDDEKLKHWFSALAKRGIYG